MAGSCQPFNKRRSDQSQVNPRTFAAGDTDRLDYVTLQELLILRPCEHYFCVRNAMSLSPVACPAWETIRGVRFAMLYGPTLVTVLVTQAALDEIDRATTEMGGRLACFHKHRNAIEQVASVKHQRGLLEESGAIVVQAGDLKPPHP
jgi:uncharacterized protein DUF1488